MCMRNCWNRGMGIILMIFGFGLIISFILPMEFLIVILTLIVIYIGFLIFKNC